MAMSAAFAASSAGTTLRRRGHFFAADIVTDGVEDFAERDGLRVAAGEEFLLFGDDQQAARFPVHSSRGRGRSRGRRDLFGEMAQRPARAAGAE